MGLCTTLYDVLVILFLINKDLFKCILTYKYIYAVDKLWFVSVVIN